MSKYQEYGKKLDSLARKRIAEYQKAKENYLKAKKRHEDFPFIPGLSYSYQEEIKARRLELDFREAEEEMREAEKTYRKGYEEEIRDIRRELYQELKEDTSVNPNDLDRNVVDLLQSGICKADEIAKLFNDASNVTTKRYIGNFAKSQVKADTDDKDRIILNNIANASVKMSDPGLASAMEKYDALSDVYTRCVKNPGFIPYYDHFSEQALSEM